MNIVRLLRSPNATNSNNVRNVATSGGTTNTNARNNRGVVPDYAESEHKVSPMGGNQSTAKGTLILAPKKAKTDIDATYLYEVIVATNNGMENLW